MSRSVEGDRHNEWARIGSDVFAVAPTTLERKTMEHRRWTKAILASIPVLLFMPAFADDWPQWMGPQRDDVWRETGVVTAIPASGLPVKWRTPIGLGYAGPAVAGGKVFVMDYVRQSGETKNNSFNTDELGGTERVLCLDAATGKLLWKHEYARPYKIAYSSGPRCTPTVDGDKVYTLGAEGNLCCLDAATGKVIWSKDFTKDYGAKTATWGYASHPLVVGDTLYCVVGSKDGVALALDKNTGRERWRALPAEAPGYCPPSLIEHDGKRQLIIWHGESLNSVEPDTGKVNWSVPLKPSYGMAIAAPRKAGSLLFASSFKDVGALLKLKQGASGAEIVWKGNPKNALYSGTVSPFIEGDVVYGCDADSGSLTGVRLSDGERLWQTTAPTTGEGKKGRYGTAFLIKHGDKFFLFNEQGDLILAKLSPKGYEELGRFHVLEPSNKTFGRAMVWSHPAFAQRCLFARNDKELVCVDLSAQDAANAERSNIELVKTLDARGGFISLEGNSLFLTSGVNTNVQQAGYWFDIGPDPASPALVCATLPAAWQVAVAGEHAFVCDYTKFLTVCETRDRQWRQVAKLPMPSQTENIVIRGKLAYIANHVGGLTIVDISTPSKPAIVSNFNPNIDCDAIALWQDCVILYGHWESRLVLVDVSDPAKPRQTGVYQHDPKTFNQGEMEVENGFAYCTAVNGLVIVNVADRANPKLAKAVPFKGPTTDVIVKDGYAFVAGAGGVRVLDVSDPFQPAEVGSYKGSAANLAVQRAAASASSAGYYIYVANKKEPAMVLLFHAPAKRGGARQ